jgi:molybdenum cofactor cytidylyltransferase
VHATRSASGWLAALGDMPRIAPATHRDVKRALAEGALIAAAVDAVSGRRGHPVAFGASLGDELVRLDGDEGARTIVTRHREHLVSVNVSDPGIFMDIDMPSDLLTTT